MSEDFGPTFITVTDEDGKEIVLEFIDALELDGQVYQAFFPAETEDEEEDPVELAKLAENRAREHAQNLIKMMYNRKAMRKEAGMGMREGKEDAGPL